jgi:hypothetical protein
MSQPDKRRGLFVPRWHGKTAYYRGWHHSLYIAALREATMKHVPVRVTFGELEAFAIEVPSGPLSGLHLKIGEQPTRYFGAMDDIHQAYRRIGEIPCDLCHQRFRFMNDGRVFSFPCTSSGWLFFEPSVPVEGQPLTCRVRCPKCLEKLESYVSGLF